MLVEKRKRYNDRRWTFEDRKRLMCRETYYLFIKKKVETKLKASPFNNTKIFANKNYFKIFEPKFDSDIIINGRIAKRM